jgi:3-oxoadipate enol-lactonase
MVEGADHGPPVMFSNSLGSDLEMWDAQAAALKDRFRVIRYDSRGHGKSVVSDGPYSIADLGEDACAIMDALGTGPVFWCGLSKGGMVGQWLLRHRPERLIKAVLANTAPHMPGPELWNGRIRLVREKGMGAIVDAMLARWFSDGFRAERPDVMARTAAMITRQPVEGYAACCAAIRDMDQRNSLRTANRPVLVIVGSDDPSTTPAMGQLIADAIPGARVTTLTARHLSNLERPAEFNQALLDFFS